MAIPALINICCLAYACIKNLINEVTKLVQSEENVTFCKILGAPVLRKILPQGSAIYPIAFFSPK